MLQQNEVVMLAMGIGVLAFAFAQRVRLSQVPAGRLLLTAYALLVLAWTATVVEGWVLPDVCNAIEHGSHAAAAILLLLWCIAHTRRREKGDGAC